MGTETRATYKGRAMPARTTTLPSGTPLNAREDRLPAIGLMCLTVALFAVLDSTAKYLVEVGGLPIMQVVWVRFLGHFILTLVIFAPYGLRSLVLSKRLGHQLARSVLMFIITALNFAALKYLQLDQNVTIFFLAPFIVAALAGPLLGEWIGWRRLAAIMVGFLGVLLVVRPGFGGFHWAFLLAFGATFCYALYNISTRFLSGFDDTKVTQFYSPAAGALLAAPIAIWFWQWPAEPFHWLLLLSMGASGGFAHWLLIRAHRLAPAPILAPFTYTSLIWMSIAGFLVFGHLPSIWTLSGGAVMVSSGLYLLLRERMRA